MPRMARHLPRRGVRIQHLDVAGAGARSRGPLSGRSTGRSAVRPLPPSRPRQPVGTTELPGSSLGGMHSPDAAGAKPKRMSGSEDAERGRRKAAQGPEQGLRGPDGAPGEALNRAFRAGWYRPRVADEAPAYTPHPRPHETMGAGDRRRVGVGCNRRSRIAPARQLERCNTLRLLHPTFRGRAWRVRWERWHAQCAHERVPLAMSDAAVNPPSARCGTRSPGAA